MSNFRFCFARKDRDVLPSCNFFFVVFFSFFIFAESDGQDSGWSEEQIRILTGKTDELERKIADLEKEIKFLSESLVKKQKEEDLEKDAELIAGKTPEEIVKIASDYIDDNNLVDARKILRLFIKKNPSDVHVGMMMFFLGESYFKEKDYKAAIKEYKDSYTTNPDGSKSAEVLYKLAICFKNLSKPDEARTILDKLIADYPGSTSIIERAKKLKSTI
jgi:TolA-binding protein